MNLLRKVFLHNAGLKLLSLLIAFLLWSSYTSEPRVAARSQATRRARRDFPHPLGPVSVTRREP